MRENPEEQPALQHRPFHDIAFISGTGELNLGNADELKQLVSEYIEMGRSHFLLDAKEITYVDSSGVGSAINVMERARKAGGRAIICRASATVRKTWEMAKLNCPEEFACGSLLEGVMLLWAPQNHELRKKFRTARKLAQQAREHRNQGLHDQAHRMYMAALETYRGWNPFPWIFRNHAFLWREFADALEATGFPELAAEAAMQGRSLSRPYK